MKSLRDLSAELMPPPVPKQEGPMPFIDMAEWDEARDRARTALAEASQVMARLEPKRGEDGKAS